MSSSKSHLPPELRRLRARRKPVPRAQAGKDQRRRLIAAAIDCVNKQGYEAVTLPDLLERSGSHYRTLVKHFGDKHGLITAAHDAALDEIRRRFRLGAERRDDPTEAFREGLDAMLSFLAVQSRIARFAMLRVPFAIPGGIGR